MTSKDELESLFNAKIKNVLSYEYEKLYWQIKKDLEKLDKYEYILKHLKKHVDIEYEIEDLENEYDKRVKDEV